MGYLKYLFLFVAKKKKKLLFKTKPVVISMLL